ncbi:hypothetical protein [Echinicola soli]|nr:hypothetical protein [Echinicola soli]
MAKIFYLNVKEHNFRVLYFPFAPLCTIPFKRFGEAAESFLA